MKQIFLTTLATLTIGMITLSADENTGLYVGLGYAATNIDLTVGDNIIDTNLNILDTGTDSILLISGYDINSYFALEGRYLINATEAAVEYETSNTPLSGNYKADTFAIYAKPKYNLGAVTLYGLLGFAYNDYTLDAILGGNNDDTLFSWGGGAKFNVTQSIGLFVDYTDFGESDNLVKTNITSWNFGATYKF